MLDFLNLILSAFSSFVELLFDLPYFPGLSYGYLILAISLSIVLLRYLIGRMK